MKFITYHISQNSNFWYYIYLLMIILNYLKYKNLFL